MDVKGAGTSQPELTVRRMERCPRFDGCSAPVCPLMGLTGTHLRGDEVCFYLREASKPGGEARLRCYLPEDLKETIVEATSTAIALHGDIARALRRASTQGSKLDGAAHARQAKTQPQLERSTFPPLGTQP